MVDRAERLAHTASWEWDLETDDLLWSDNMYRLLDLRPGQVTPTPDYVLSRMHASDSPRVAREIDAARQEGRLPDVTYRIERPGGGVRWLRSFSRSPRSGTVAPRIWSVPCRTSPSWWRRSA